MHRRNPKKPHVGLGLDHGEPKAPNMTSWKWALGRLKALRGEGYRRVVIERDSPEMSVPYFNHLAREAKRMGFSVAKEPKGPFKRHCVVVRDGNATKFFYDLAAGAERSEAMTSKAFARADTIIVGGKGHIIHAERHISGDAGVRFVPEYDTPPSKEMLALSDLAWNLYKGKK